MRFQVLGPLTVLGPHGAVALGGPKERIVLAHLLAAANQFVPLDALADSVWAGAPPRTAAKSLQTYVLRLRNALEPQRCGLLVTGNRGYRIVLDDHEFDADLFEKTAARGHRELRAGRHSAAAVTLRAALSLWRGEPFPELAHTDIGAAAVARLTELRLEALEHRVDAELADDEPGLIAELNELVTAYPLHERFWAQLMLAQYRAGRQAEALDVYRRARDHLDSELGVEPGPELRGLHAAVLRHDPALARPRSPGMFVGRAAELAELRAGRGKVHLTGPPGIGKSRLVAELAAQLLQEGRPVRHIGDRLVVEDDQLVVLAANGPTPAGWERIELGPLPREDLARLVREWDVPAHIAERAEGNAGVAHDLAQAYLRGQVADAVRGSARDQAGLAAARDHLAESIAGLAELDMAPPRDHDHCPYPGLAVFDIGDAPDFHGREHLVAQLVARLATTRLLGVVGPSGSGKSSVVRAGLLAALRKGALPGSENWTLRTMRPGSDAVSELRRIDEGVVFVDQFQEVFTTCPQPAEFLDAVMSSELIVVVAIRSDYYGHCATHPELARKLADQHVLVGPMREAEVLRAIERPAHRAGLRLEEGLSDALAGAVVDRPGALPLLSTTLRELWEQRDGATLTLRAYVAAGGVEGAVARLAERAYDRVTAFETVRAVFLRLTGPGEGDEVARRRLPVAELADLPLPDVGHVIEVFTEARVLTVSDGHVELAHEALLRHWPRLRAWLDEDTEGRELHRKLTIAATEWVVGGREPADLYRGARLVSTLDWAEAHRAELTGIEGAFLCAARRLAQADADRVRKRNRRLRWLSATLVVLLVAAVLGGWRAVWEQRRADAAAVAADARRLGAQALIERDIGLAMLLAVQAVRLDDTPQTRGNLLATLQRSPDLVGAAGTTDGGRLLALTLSPDRTVVATGSFTGEIRLYDAATLQIVKTLRHPGHRPVMGLAFGPDGIVSWGARDGIAVWSGDRLVRTFGPPGEATGMVTADGTALVLCHTGTGSVTRWDLRTGSGTELMPPGSCERAAGSSDRRTLIVAARASTVLINVETGERRTLAVDNGTALSPDGTTLVATPDDDPAKQGELQLWDVPSGRMRVSARRHTATVMAVTWSSDGKTLASGANDRLGVVWDAQALRPVRVLTGHAGRLMNQVYTNGSLLTAALDGSLLAWDLTDTRGLRRRITGPAAAEYGNTMYDPRRNAVVAVSSHHTDIIDAETGRLIRRIETGETTGADLADDMLALSHPDGTAQLFDLSTGRSMGRRGTVGSPATSVAVNGETVALALELPEGGRIDLTTGGSLTTAAPVAELRFTPDGQRLIAGLLNGQVVVWNLRDHHVVLDVHPTGFPVWTFAFSPDGRSVAMGGVLGRPSVWRTDTWERQWQASAGHNGYDLSLSFAPNGRTLASSGTDSLTFLYDTNSGTLLGNAVGDADNLDVFAHYSSGGLAVLDSSGGLSYWDADRDSWLRRACAIAGRDLTAAEWQRHLPERSQVSTCP